MRYRDSGIKWIGEVPSHWEVVRLKDLVKTFNGYNFNPTDFSQFGIPIIRIGDIEPKIKELDAAAKYPERLPEMNRYQVAFGDILLAMTGSTIGKVGQLLIEQPALINQRICAFRACAPLKQSYLYYILQSIQFNLFIKFHSIGCAQDNISIKQIEKFPLPLPPKSEQNRISQYLTQRMTELDKLQKALKKEVDSLYLYKKLLISKIVMQGLERDTPLRKSDQWFGKLPAHWEVDLLSKFYTLRSQKVNDREYTPLSITKNGVVLQLKKAAKSNCGENRKLVKKGDFIINSRSDRKGACGISPYEGSASLVNIVLSPKNGLNSEYFGWLASSHQFAEQFYRLGKGIASDLWVTRWGDMKKMKLPIPTLSEQERISEYLTHKTTEIDNVITNIESMREKIGKYRCDLISAAVTGKVAVE